MGDEKRPFGDLFRGASGNVQLGGLSVQFGQPPSGGKPILETLTLEQLERLAAELAGELKLLRSEIKRRAPKF